MHTVSPALKHLPEYFNGEDSSTRCLVKIICTLWVGMVQSFLSYWMTQSLFQKT